MKYYRFMSQREFDSLLRGETLKNQNPHEGCATRSVGFCFLGEDSATVGCGGAYGIGIGDDPIWEQADNLVGGTCGASEVFVEFEGGELNASVGVYADLYGAWGDLVLVKEYCTTQYNSGTLKPIRAYGRLPFDQYGYQEIRFTCLEPDYWWDKYGE